MAQQDAKVVYMHACMEGALLRLGRRTRTHQPCYYYTTITSISIKYMYKYKYKYKNNLRLNLCIPLRSSSKLSDPVSH